MRNDVSFSFYYFFIVVYDYGLFLVFLVDYNFCEVID